MKSAPAWPRNAGLAALACAGAMGLAPAAAEARVYFSAFLGPGGSGIERAGLDGSGLEVLQLQPTGFADGIALDTRDGKVYWTDTNASVIWRADLNGDEAQIVLDDFGSEPLGIALDVAAAKMYFTDGAGVKRASLTGGEVELLTKEGAHGFIALDLAAQRMYWADWRTGTVKAAPMTANATVTNLVTHQAAPFGVALDLLASQVYWLQLNLNKKKSEKDAIRRANLAGGEIQTVLERPGAGFEGGLAIDPGAGKLYWSEAEARDIAVANLDGSRPQTLIHTGEDSPVGLAVESANARPANTSPPTIEGAVQVAAVASCNPGAWNGTGPISLAYQWGIVAGTALEGATGSSFVPSADEAGLQLACVVSATDNIATTTATSAAVPIAPFPGALTAPATGAEIPLIAGIALAELTSSGTRAHVPVFANLPCRATLKATPALVRHGRRRSVARRGGHAPRVVTTTRRLTPGRNTLTLAGLVPGTTYRLSLVVLTADGQRSSDAATLTVARGRRP